MWFVMYNFWDLNIWLVGMFFRFFCKLFIAGVVFVVIIFGFVLFLLKFKFLIEVVLISYVLLLCNIENRFFNYSSIYYYGLEDDVMYFSYMVMVIIFVGLVLVRRFNVDGRIGSRVVWILICLYILKLVMLFIILKFVVWVFVVLLLVVSSFLFFYRYCLVFCVFLRFYVELYLIIFFFGCFRDKLKIVLKMRLW